MNEVEIKVEKKIKTLKTNLLESYDNNKLFTKPIINQSELWGHPLYKFFVDMPKGADLHAHGGANIPCWRLIDFLKDNEDISICVSGSNKYMLGHAQNNLKGYIPFKKAYNEGYISKEELINNWTMINCRNNLNPWDKFQKLFDFHDAVNEVGPAYFDFVYNTLKYNYERNINYTELRFYLLGTRQNAIEKIRTLKKAIEKAKKDFGNIDARIIIIGLKTKKLPKSATQEIINNMLYLYKTETKLSDGSNLIVGFDLVNQEDSSRSISEYKDMLLDIKKQGLNLNLYLHAGESVEPLNFEIEKALKLGSKRIGHGYNLYMHSHLKSQIIENNVCLEVCPESNLVLNYCKDMRTHPAKKYLKENIPMVLCSDDPLYQENETLSDDFFHTFLAWNLSLSDIKNLCLNSINYSSLNDISKEEKIKEFLNDWTCFLNKIK